MDDLLLGLKDEAQVILLPRGQAQAEHYRAPRFAGIRIVDTALDIVDIAPDCDLFIGAGGTMTREMAVLGIPTISVYQEALLDVDRFLLAQGAFLHRPQLKAPEALDYLRTMARSEPNRDLLIRGRKAYDLVRANILDNRG
jgi:predicted glycosyltransferase